MHKMNHHPRSVVLLSVLVTLLAVGGTASSASATGIQFEWHVGGSSLASGASKEVTAKDKTPIKLKLSLAGAVIEMTSSQISVPSGYYISGGTPGTGPNRLILEKVKVAKPTLCGVKEIGSGEERISIVAKTEIVEAATKGRGVGKTDLLFKPVGPGNQLTSAWEFTGSECVLRGTVSAIEGSVLAAITPQKAEATVNDLTFEEGKKEYRNSKEEFRTAGLTSGAAEAALTGEGELALVSKEAFGAF